MKRMLRVRTYKPVISIVRPGLPVKRLVLSWEQRSGPSQAQTHSELCRVVRAVVKVLLELAAGDVNTPTQSTGNTSSCTLLFPSLDVTKRDTSGLHNRPVTSLRAHRMSTAASSTKARSLGAKAGMYTRSLITRCTE
jgi:hypothetical protein